MSALRAKYDATTKLLAAQCDTVDRLRAEVPRAPTRARGEGALRRVRAGVLAQRRRRRRVGLRVQVSPREEVRQDAGARRSRRANDDARDRPSTRDDVFPPPPRGTSGASPESPRDAPHPATHAPSSSLPPPPRQAIEIATLLERAKRAETSAEDANERAPAPRTHPSTRFGAGDTRSIRRARRRASRRIRRRLRPRRRVRRRRRRTRRTRARARVRKHPPRRAPAPPNVGVERDDAPARRTSRASKPSRARKPPRRPSPPFAPKRTRRTRASPNSSPRSTPRVVARPPQESAAAESRAEARRR